VTADNAANVAALLINMGASKHTRLQQAGAWQGAKNRQSRKAGKQVEAAEQRVEASGSLRSDGRGKGVWFLSSGVQI
jgi:hypothetical protein